MKVYILPNMTRERALPVTRSVIDELLSLGVTPVLDKALFGSFSDSNAVFSDECDAVSECDTVIAVGGDGSFIRAAILAAENGKPVLGINAGSLAFLAGLEGDETALLSKLVDGSFFTDSRMMLEVRLLGSQGELIKKSLCINDAAITRGEHMHLLRLSLSKNGEELNRYNADGLIVSTPTGSTAYSFSAGGPLIEPNIECIAVTPVCSHAMMSRALILGDDAKLSITLGSDDSAVLSCDSRDAEHFCSGMTVEIEKSPLKCDFIRIKTNSFLGILKDKFAQRTI